MALLEPGDILDHRRCSRLDAAMVAIDASVLADLGVLEALGFLFLDEELDIFVQACLVGLEREQVIALLVDDFLGDLALAADRIDGDGTAPGLS